MISTTIIYDPLGDSHYYGCGGISCINCKFNMSSLNCYIWRRDNNYNIVLGD